MTALESLSAGCRNTATYVAHDPLWNVDFFVCSGHKGAFFESELSEYSGGERCGWEGDLPASDEDVEWANKREDAI